MADPIFVLTSVLVQVIYCYGDLVPRQGDLFNEDTETSSRLVGRKMETDSFIHTDVRMSGVKKLNWKNNAHSSMRA